MTGIGDAERDLRLVLAVQGLRAFGYGFSSVLLGTALAAGGLSATQVGVIFATMLTGMACFSLLVGRYADRLGRRRTYLTLLITMGISAALFALTNYFPLLLLAAFTGTLSTDPNESGPITTLEQAMMASVPAPARARGFGRYNAIAYLTGSLGALLAGGPAALRDLWSDVPTDQRWLLILSVSAFLAVLVASRLGEAVEPSGAHRSRGQLTKSRSTVRRLSALFAVDAFAGGFVVQAFLVYWFARRYDASPELMGVVFFAAGLLQAASSVLAGKLGERIGLLNTMVFSHLPSNLLLAVLPLAPGLPAAVTLLLARAALSQMDVPARQAYVVTMVDPAERTAAAAYTNTARYAARPVAPLAATALSQLAWPGLPFLIAGTLRIGYDLTLFVLFRHARPPAPDRVAQAPSEPSEDPR
ncbi:MFS transporter [Streptomyces sp. NBC_01363]|uniref:MFS transporter n=1 Tax=Streptomyces sp. NBC_01363 TaxID=2903840 RepID=UPI002252073C|nr:MFS transporter [Streptomyces sp. NBC_01363]MCX4734104.1 MFS transporter [Streptomyces sp. NBC_01363]